MSFLDRVTKAVSGTVDRGKKEVDQFMRIQKVKGEIGTAEKAIDEARSRIHEVTLQAGGKAIEMLRAGTMISPELQQFVDQVAEVERQISSQEAVIVEKKAEIESIKAEDEAQKAAPAHDEPPSTGLPVPPPLASPQATPVVDAEPLTPPPVPVPPPPAIATAATHVCPACGHQVSGNAAFCSECGTKIA